MNQKEEAKPSLQSQTKKVKHVTLSAGGESITGTGYTSASILSPSVLSADLSSYSDATAGVVKKPLTGPPDDFVSNSKSRFEVFTYDEKMSQTDDDSSEDSDDTQLQIWWKRFKKHFELKGMGVGISLTQMVFLTCYFSRCNV